MPISRLCLSCNWWNDLPSEISSSLSLLIFKQPLLTPYCLVLCRGVTFIQKVGVPTFFPYIPFPFPFLSFPSFSPPYPSFSFLSFSLYPSLSLPSRPVQMFPGYYRGLHERWMTESRCYFFLSFAQKVGVPFWARVSYACGIVSDATTAQLRTRCGGTFESCAGY